MKKKILAVCGPTGSGKTSLAIKLAKRLDGEIISMDSMQVYKHMNIGTAKVTHEEADGIPHHLIDVVSPDESFSCAEFRTLADKAVEDIIGLGKVPILCGGTGLYLDSLLNLSGFSPDVSPEIRPELEKRDPSDLWEELCRVDPESAAATHPNNLKRVIRALEIYHGTGKTKSEWDRLSRTADSDYTPLIVCLEFLDRQKLYERTDMRVDEMLSKGLEEECRRLDLPRDSNSAQAIGYKEIYLWLDGKISREEAVELLKKNTRNYVKRQLTWFRRYENALRFCMDRDNPDEIIETIVGEFEKI